MMYTHTVIQRRRKNCDQAHISPLCRHSSLRNHDGGPLSLAAMSVSRREYKTRRTSQETLTPSRRRGIIVFRNLRTPEWTKEELTGIQCVIQTHLQIDPSDARTQPTVSAIEGNNAVSLCLCFRFSTVKEPGIRQSGASERGERRGGSVSEV